MFAPRLSVLDILEDNADIALPLATFLQMLPAMRIRQYSISSSPLASPEAIRLTVSVVRYAGERGVPRAGVCSGHLADAAPGAEVPVLVKPSPHFRPPADPDTPLVMVGPGTGIAPFLGFLDERRARANAQGETDVPPTRR